MMETKTGTIKSVSVKEGNTNNKVWKSYTFEMEDGKKYSTFDEKLGTTFKAGDSVSMEGEANGKYWNMKSMVKENSSEVSSNKPEQDDTSFYTAYAKDVFIALMGIGKTDVMPTKDRMNQAIKLVKQAKEAFS